MRYQTHLYYILAVAIILSFRVHQTLLHPELRFEDGVELFAYYFNNPGLSEILKPYNGYVALLPNLIGYISLRFPLTAAPYILTFLTFFISVIAYSIFILPRFEHIVKETHIRGAICILLALLPLGKNYLLVNASYSIWNGLIILTFMYLAPFSRNIFLCGLQFIAATVLALSHPLSILLLPLVLLALYRDRSVQTFITHGLLFTITIIYALSIASKKATFIPNYNYITEVIQITGYRAFIEGFIGTRLSLKLINLNIPWLFTLSYLSLVFLAAFLWHKKMKLFVTVSLLMLISLAIPLISLSLRHISIDTLLNSNLQRYFYISKYLTVLVFTIVLYKHISMRVKHRNIYRAFYSIAVFLVIISANNQRLYRGSTEESQRLSTFLTIAEENRLLEKKGLPYKNQLVYERSNTRWSIKLNYERHRIHRQHFPVRGSSTQH